MQKLLRLPRVQEQTGLSRATIYEKMAEGSFPKPVQLNRRCVGWVEAEIDDWVAARIAEREAEAA